MFHVSKDHQSDLNSAKEFVMAMRKEQEVKGDRYAQMLRELDHSMGPTEQVPVMVISEVVRKHGFYFRV